MLKSLVTCSLCNDILRHASCLHCKHHFCMDCIVNFTDSQADPHCPKCKLPATRREAKFSPEFDKLVATYKVLQSAVSVDSCLPKVVNCSDGACDSSKEVISSIPVKFEHVSNFVKFRKRPSHAETDSVDGQFAEMQPQGDSEVWQSGGTRNFKSKKVFALAQLSCAFCKTSGDSSSIMLFEDISFYFLGNYKPAYKADLQALVFAAGGGIMVSSDQQVQWSKVVVYNADVDPATCSGDIDEVMKERLFEAKSLAYKIKARVVEHTWIPSCIASYQLLPCEF